MKKTILSLVVLSLLVLAGCASSTPEEVSYNADSWKDVIADSCQSFFDGCNQCMKMPGSDEAACTRMFCETYAEPYCTDEDVAGEVVNTDEDPAIIDRETDQRAAAEQYVAQYIWLSVQEAQALAQEQSLSFRVVEEDGEGLAATMDYRPGRFNATVNDGVVTAIMVE
jgi:hypothetical protein